MKAKENKDQKFSWDSISIDKYYKIKNIFDSEKNVLSRDIEIAAIILDIDPEEIWNMGITEAQLILNKLSFLDDFKLNKINPSKIEIDGERYNLEYDAKKMTVAQYADWQQFVKMSFEDSIDKLISVFLIPEGKKYNEGYDIIELQRKIREKLPFVTAQSILNFTLVKYVESLKRSLKCLARIAKREKNKEIEDQIQHLKETLCFLGCAL